MKIDIFAALALALVLAACSTASDLPVLHSGPVPDDPGSQIRPVRHSNPIGDYQHRKPVEPGQWRLPDDRKPSERGGAS